MKKITLIFTSKISGQLTLNNKEIFQIDNTKTKLLICFKNSFSIYFITKDSQQYLPFLAEIKFVNDCLFSNSSNLKIIMLSYDVFFIIIEPTKYYLNSAQIFKEFKVKNKIIKFYNGILELPNKTNTQKIFIDSLPINYDFQSFNNLIILFSKQKNNNNLHLITLTDFSHISLACDYYFLKDNKITCYKLLHTFLHHKEIKVFDCETLKEIDNYIGYPPRKGLANIKEQLIPYYFIQCLMVKDLKNAKTFLDETIYNKTLTYSVASKFFGDFISFGTPQLDIEKNTICLIYKGEKKNTYNCRYFNFKISNLKITNIVEINLKMLV